LPAQRLVRPPADNTANRNRAGTAQPAKIRRIRPSKRQAGETYSNANRPPSGRVRHECDTKGGDPPGPPPNAPVGLRRRLARGHRGPGDPASPEIPFRASPILEMMRWGRSLGLVVGLGLLAGPSVALQIPFPVTIRAGNITIIRFRTIALRPAQQPQPQNQPKATCPTAIIFKYRGCSDGISGAPDPLVRGWPPGQPAAVGPTGASAADRGVRPTFVSHSLSHSSGWRTIRVRIPFLQLAASRVYAPNLRGLRLCQPYSCWPCCRRRGGQGRCAGKSQSGQRRRVL